MRSEGWKFHLFLLFSLQLPIAEGDLIVPVSPVLSTSLAGCLKVNSCACADLIPSVKLCLKGSLVQLCVMNSTPCYTGR